MNNINPLVIAENEEAKRAHQELFRWPDENYRILNGTPFVFISSLNGTVERLHITGSWQYLLKVALWKEQFNSGDIFILMKKLGLEEDEIRPFIDKPINDLFYTLYYGKRFDVLRRLCHYIRQSLHKRFGEGIFVDCHMVVTERAQIVASSL